ncbi:transcription factor Sp5-like [Schistocerca nitens]|uniref:transcription factor Sp5-like n=1 Tax=Schistocerca nitens TaxID=7011 RepID=UPI00211976EB|nr:transcription factor Sp5-like [Schistocerca nitens]
MLEYSVYVYISGSVTESRGQASAAGKPSSFVATWPGAGECEQLPPAPFRLLGLPPPPPPPPPSSGGQTGAPAPQPVSPRFPSDAGARSATDNSPPHQLLAASTLACATDVCSRQPFSEASPRLLASLPAAASSTALYDIRRIQRLLKTFGIALVRTGRGCLGANGRCPTSGRTAAGGAGAAASAGRERAGACWLVAAGWWPRRLTPQLHLARYATPPLGSRAPSSRPAPTSTPALPRLGEIPRKPSGAAATAVTGTVQIAASPFWYCIKVGQNRVLKGRFF